MCQRMWGWQLKREAWLSTGRCQLETGLLPGREYSLSIATVSGSGSYLATSQKVTTAKRIVPAAPTAVKVSGVTSSSIALSWDAAEGDLDGYGVTVIPIDECQVAENATSAEVEMVTFEELHPNVDYNITLRVLSGEQGGELLTISTKTKLYYLFPMNTKVADGIYGTHLHAPLAVYGEVNLVKGWLDNAASFPIGQGRMETERGSAMSMCIASEAYCDSGYATYFWFNPGKTSSFSTAPGEGIDLYGIKHANNEAHPGFLVTSPSASRGTFRLQMTVDHTMYQAFVTLPDDWWSHILFVRTNEGKAVIGVNGIEVSDVTSISVQDVDDDTDTWLFIGPTEEQPISCTVTFDQLLFYQRWIPPVALFVDGIGHKLRIEQPNKPHTNGDLTCRANGNITTTSDSPTGSGLMLGSAGYLNCGNKYMSCVGSTVYCPRGFSLVFWLKVQCDGDASNRTVISNMGELSPEISRGVRVVYHPGSQELVSTMATRDGDVYETQATIPLGTWTEIRVVGTNEGSTLIVGSLESVGVKIASFGELTDDKETTLIIGRDKECPIPGYVGFKGVCYKNFAEEKTYDEARQTCAADGGLLAMPKDGEINAFIFDLGDGYRWLGLNDIDSEGQWVFEDSQTLVSIGYSSWTPSEPSNSHSSGEDCAQIWTGAMWNDEPCSRTYGFICQIYADQGCQFGYSYLAHTDRCYRAYDDGKTYDEALATCQADVGTLAMPRDDTTNDFLIALKNAANIDTWFYLGLDRRGGSWTNVDGGELSYTDWADGQPSARSSEECGDIFPGSDSRRDKWNDTPCSTNSGFICEAEKGVNVAMGKTAFQTSTQAGADASRAVNGNTNTDSTAGSCTHTVVEDNPRWWVDLGHSYTVDRVVIFNRQECCPDRLNPFNIHIGDSDQVSTNPKCGGDHQIDVTKPSITVPCRGMKGRYVGVRLPGPSRILTLCEVQVVSLSPGAQLVGLWPLNAESGASDVTGNGNDGVATGTQLAPGPFGDTDGAFLFSGTADSYLDIPNNGRLDVRYSYTILAHVYATGSRGPILTYVTDNNDFGVHWFQMDPQQVLNRAVGRHGINISPYPQTSVLTQNAWSYVGASYNSVTGMAALWNNGQLVAETYVGVAELKTQYPIRVAVRVRDGDPRFFAGRIACLQLYNYAMTPGQIESARYKCKASDEEDERVKPILPSLSIADFQFKEYALTSTQLRTIDSYLEHFPTRCIRLHSKDKPWITPEIKNLISLRQSAFHNGTTSEWKSLRNKLQAKIRRARQTFYSSKVDNLRRHDPANWHKDIKSMANIGKSNPVIHVDGITPDNSKATADAINASLSKITQSLPPLDISHLPAFLPALQPPQVSVWEMYDTLQRVRVRKAAGPDNITGRLIREFAYELSHPLTCFFNTSLCEGRVPREWREATVIPIPKTKPPSVEELRPISLTSLLAKVCEGFIAKWTLSDIFPNIDPKQFGGLPGKSTTHCLVDIIHHLSSTSNLRGTLSTIVLTDFSKAFDRVEHTTAVRRLLELGCRPSLIPWIYSFLTERRQRVLYQSSYSAWEILTCGLPQGTVLAPIIFIAMINSAVNNARTNKWKFVDDLTLIESRLVRETSLLQRDLNALEQWTTDSHMKLHPRKCKVMHVYFTKVPPPLPTLYMDGLALQDVYVVKLLGVIVQSDLKWDAHVSHITSQSSKRLFLLRRLKSFKLPVPDLTTVYISYVRPLCEYACPVWSPGLTATQSSQIENVQRRACRIILGSNYTRYREARCYLGLPTLQERREQLILKFGRGLLKSNIFREWLPPTRGETSGRTTRSCHKLNTISARTNRFKNSAIPHIVRLLNS
ncbi:MRC2 [Branchiostoma lanceolatum]|uniref:MRC2 protein n=1 Tax=Branchiostoma lanceolatum TaxID=7740 RepID=A0A8J9YZ67_BRALA|nr:MRC2 [Branchiostoma lanceolatum]